MANYFNTLSLGQKLDQLSKCRFMDTSEFDTGVDALKNKKIVMVGHQLHFHPAVIKMKNTNDTMINTKEKLKDYLFNFHNEVSNRSGKQVYDKSILLKYKQFIPLKGYLHFTKCFFRPYYSLNFNQWKRDMLLKKLNKEMLSIWFSLF